MKERVQESSSLLSSFCYTGITLVLIRQCACPFALQKNMACLSVLKKNKPSNKLKTYDIDIYYKDMCHRMSPLALGTEPF